jgi:hypothetical protein
MDGGLPAIADVSHAMSVAGAAGAHRLIAGVTVMLHTRDSGSISRCALPATPTSVFRSTFFAGLNCSKRSRLLAIAGSRQPMGAAAGRSTSRHGRPAGAGMSIAGSLQRARRDVVTTEVPGLAEALRRPPVDVDAALRLTDGSYGRVRAPSRR